MKKILEKNNSIFIILGLTFLFSLLMIIFIYNSDIKKDFADKDLSILKIRVKRLNNSKPSPTEKNINSIKCDLKHFEEASDRLESHFGNIYDKALNAFIESLNASSIAKKSKFESTTKTAGIKDKTLNSKIINDATKQEFIRNWKNFVAKEKKKDEYLEPAEILNRFRIYNKYSESEFEKAKNAFKNAFQENTVEKLSEYNLNDYILAALGIPLNLTRIGCREFLVNIQRTLEEKLQTAKIISPSEKLKLFDEFASIPSEKQIPPIIKYCRFYEDIFSRMINSKIETLQSHKKLNGLEGIKKGNFLILQHEFHIISSLKALRSFLNSLQEAYRDNRIYVVKDIHLVKTFSSVNQSIQKKNNEALSTNQYESEKANQQDKDQVLIELGTSDLVNATIRLDYMIYDKPKMNL